MSASLAQPLEDFLNRHDEEAWSTTLTELLPLTHEVDRTATQVWFSFYPLALLQALQRANDPSLLARQLLLEGKFYLKDQIDSSHHFLYGHRYWSAVKQAVTQYASSQSESIKGKALAEIIKEVAQQVAQSAKIDSSLLTGITAVAFMTLQQVGLGAFSAAPGTVQISRGYGKRSPEQVLAERAADDNQGLFGFLRKADKKWTVTFDEADDNAWFTAIDQEELASAAARDDSQEWLSVDARRVEGPIPVQCRSAACGTCWVGVLSGAEKLSDVSARENKKIKEFGYIDTSEPRPIIRLACVAQAMGAVSIVIPPWNGVFGKHLERLKGEQAKVDQKSIADESPVVGSLG